MCRRSKNHCGGYIYLTFFFTLVLGLTAGQAWGQYRAAYWDQRYWTSWADEEVTIDVRDAFQTVGYEILNADEIKSWMDARIADHEASVVVFCRDVAPVTVIEWQSPDCTLRKYLDAGGKIVWYSDIPLYYQGLSDGSTIWWGGGGCANILGITGVDWTNTTNSEVTLTDGGIDWGLTKTWRSERWTPADQVDIVLASDIAGNAAAWVKHFVPGDTTGGFIRVWDIDVSPDNRPGFEDLLAVAEYGLGSSPCACNPDPADGAMHTETWVRMTWTAGDFAVSHDVYFGENFDGVNDGTGDTFRGNHGLGTEFYIAGFAGYAYPEGLVYGETYYWRIDEVNDADPNSPWKGDVWSFWIPPRKAYEPVPSDGGKFIDAENLILSWTPGIGAISHTVYFGDDYDTVSNATGGTASGLATYTPGPLELARTYYWRVDEFDNVDMYKGDVWSFTTEGAAAGPKPADGDVDVKPSVLLGWNAGVVAASHEVYFGTDADAVKNAATDSPEYKGSRALGDESYDPGKLAWASTYYWRIDEVNNLHPDGRWAGSVWSFTTADFAIVDDFEDYDAADNRIFYAWLDGIGYGYSIDPPYLGNGTGSMVGDDSTSSFTEETIVHSGGKSMPYSYNNNKPDYACYSEAELILTSPRDWTEEGVVELSLWFRGNPGSVGSFVEGPDGNYTMIGSGEDIWGNADECYYAYQILTGVGSIHAQVLSLDNTHDWAKAGVMIRENLDPGSVHASMVVTPAQGVSFQRRVYTNSASSKTDKGGIAAPCWVKIERDMAGNFTAYSSIDGSTWTLMSIPENIRMAPNVYIGLAVTSHDAALTCQAVFSDVTTTGTVSGQWVSQDIGILSNDAEPLYVAVSNSAGIPVVVVHDDPAAAQISTWTEWVIPLQTFADQGIVLTDVDKIAIGLGTKGNMTVPGGSGKMYFDDIRLYRPRPQP
jgi:hypothetical protein